MYSSFISKLSVYSQHIIRCSSTCYQSNSNVLLKDCCGYAVSFI